MMTTSTTRSNGSARVSRRLGTPHHEPGSFVAFRVDPYASLAVLGDPMTDYYTKELLEPEHTKVYLGVVLEAQKPVGCGCHQLILSIIGSRPATLDHEDVNTLSPIPSGTSPISQPPVFPTSSLPGEVVYQYSTSIRVKVATTIFPEDCSAFSHGFPRMPEEDLKRFRTYAEYDAWKMKALEAAARQDPRAFRGHKYMDMAAEIAQVKTALREAPWDAFDAETPSVCHDRVRLLNYETDPTLPGGTLHWEPVVTIWMDPHEVGNSLTPPGMWDAEIGLLKRAADTFNRRWIEWVRAIYVLRSTDAAHLPPIYDRQSDTPRPKGVILKGSVPPSGLATRDVTVEHHDESNQGDKKVIAAEDPIPFREKSDDPAPAKSQRINRPDRRASRLRDARAAINRLTTAAKFVGGGVRLATIGSYHVAKLSIHAIRYVVATSLTLTAGANHIQPPPRSPCSPSADYLTWS